MCSNNLDGKVDIGRMVYCNGVKNKKAAWTDHYWMVNTVTKGVKRHRWAKAVLLASN